MATIEGLQKALDNKTLDPSDFDNDQKIILDELLRSGNLKGYNSINEIIRERAGAAVDIARQKQAQINPFQKATKEAGFEITRADLETVGDLSLGTIAYLQDKDKLINTLKKSLGAVEYGVDRQALNFRTMQFDKYEKLLKSAPIIRGIKPFARVAGVVGKMADGFRQIRKAGASQFLQTELKSIGYGAGGAFGGSLAFDAANYATDFTAASTLDISELTDDDVSKLPAPQKMLFHALAAAENATLFNGGAASLGPLLQLAGSGIKRSLGLSGPDVENIVRASRESGVPTNILAVTDENSTFFARGVKNLLNVVGVFPATSGPGLKYKQEIEEETFRKVLDNLNSGAPYSHAELLSLGALNQFRKNFRDYKDIINVKYDVVFKEADLLGPDLKIIPIQNLTKSTENIINSLRAQYPNYAQQADKRLFELTEFDDPLVKFIAATKDYTEGLTVGLTAKEFIGLNKMLTAAATETKIYDPRGLVAQTKFALEQDFNTIAQSPSIKVLMNDNKQVKEAYETVVKAQGEAGGQQYVQNLIKGVNNVQKTLEDANDFFTKTTSSFQTPVARKIKQSDANLFSNLGLIGRLGTYSVNPDQMWSKTLKEVFRNGSANSIEQLKFLIGTERSATGKEIFDRFRQLYLFDAFQYAFTRRPDLTGEPMFELMAKAESRGVIMKPYLDELNQTLTQDLRMQRGIDPKKLLESQIGDRKFLDFKVQAGKFAGFNPTKFKENLGLVGDEASITAAKNRLIAMYGGGAEGQKGFDALQKIIKVMEANASYTVGDPSTFVKRRAVLGGMGALAGGVLPFAAAGAAVGIVPTLAFVFLSRYAGAVLSNPKSIDAVFDILNPSLKIEKGIKTRIGPDKKRIFAALMNNVMEEDKDAPKVDPNLINADEITNYLLRKPSQIPNAKFKMSSLPKEQLDRMYPEYKMIAKIPAAELAGYQNFLRGTILGKIQNDQADLIEANIPDPMTPRQMAMQQKEQQTQQIVPRIQPTVQTQAAQNPSLFKALNPQDTLGQAIVESRVS